VKLSSWEVKLEPSFKLAENTNQAVRDSEYFVTTMTKLEKPSRRALYLPSKRAPSSMADVYLMIRSY